MIKTLEECHVVALDDDSYINDLVETRLKEIAVRVTTFTDPQLFLKSFKALSPDLCLLDLNLGKEGVGYLVLQAIRKVLGNTIPVIIVSARSESDDIAKAFELGANDYMVKPFRKVEFQDKIKAYLQPNENSTEFYYNVPTKYNGCRIALGTTLKGVFEDQLLIESAYMLRKNLRIRLEGDWAKVIGLKPPYPKIHGTIIKNNLNPETNLFETVIKIDFFQDDLQDKVIRFFDGIR